MIGATIEKDMGRIKWRLKVLMAERELSPTQLAELTGMSYGGIIKLRRGTPSQVNTKTLAKLCEALDCRPDDLLQYIDEDDDPK